MEMSLKEIFDSNFNSKRKGQRIFSKTLQTVISFGPFQYIHEDCQAYPLSSISYNHPCSYAHNNVMYF